MTYLFCAIALLGMLLVLARGVRTRRLHFDRSVVDAMRALADRSSESHPAPRPEARLPTPVARYQSLAVGAHAPITRVLVRHGGTFRMRPSAKPSEIRGVQAFSASPPGFIWVGRVRLAPGIWLDARDQLVEGRGSMRVLLDDTITLADATGPHLDQAATLRLLAEMVWYPTALFDSRFVTWEAVDAAHARATLHVADVRVTATFVFGEDGYPRSMSAERYHDSGGLHGWGGTYSDWRDVGGMRVPFEAEVSWKLDEGTFTYAHWRMESFTYDRDIPARSRLETMLASTGRERRTS